MRKEKVKIKFFNKWAETAIAVPKADRTMLKFFTYYVILQCVIVIAVGGTVIGCVWKPDDGIFELDILARIMYLYDTNACGKPRSLKQFQDLVLSNDTFGLDIIPIRHVPVSINILTKLSQKTSMYVKVSIGFHVIWVVAAVVVRCVVNVQNMNVLKIVLMVFRFITIGIIVFDICMAIIYIADIQQSLTKAMIIRYSGWGMTPSAIRNPEEFGGWVPLIAAGMWLRGILFFGLNIYFSRFVRQVMQKIIKKEVRSRLSKLRNIPFPDPNYNHKLSQSSLHYRAGEYNKL